MKKDELKCSLQTVDKNAYFTPQNPDEQILFKRRMRGWGKILEWALD
jgi:hypothetical protein